MSTIHRFRPAVSVLVTVLTFALSAPIAVDAEEQVVAEEQILAAEDLIPGSHDYKSAVELFGSFPKDELFQASTEELRRLVVGLLQLEKHGGIRVLVRKDIFGRQVTIVVALPREKFSATLRKRLQQMFLERFHGHSVDYNLSLGETESARIFFTERLPLLGGRSSGAGCGRPSPEVGPAAAWSQGLNLGVRAHSKTARPRTARAARGSA